MSVEHWRRERAIRRALRGLSRQRVVTILQPGNVWVVECGPSRNDVTDAALRSCHLRGWAEPMADAVPSGSLRSDGTLPDGQVWNRAGSVYRITDAGWQVLHRTHAWVLVTLVVALATLVATIVGIFISRMAA